MVLAQMAREPEETSQSCEGHDRCQIGEIRKNGSDGFFFHDYSRFYNYDSLNFVLIRVLCAFGKF
jgi:hypothetical protein